MGTRGIGKEMVYGKGLSPCVPRLSASDGGRKSASDVSKGDYWQGDRQRKFVGEQGWRSFQPGAPAPGYSM